VPTISRWLHSFSAPASAETARRHFFRKTGCFLIAVAADRSARRCAVSCLAPIPVSAPLWRTRSGSVPPVLTARRSDCLDDVPVVLAVEILAFDTFSLPRWLLWFDPEAATSSGDPGPASAASIRPRPMIPSLAVRAFGLNSPTHRLLAGFDKNAEVPIGCCGGGGGGGGGGLGRRLCRNRHRGRRSRRPDIRARGCSVLERTKSNSQPAGLSTITAANGCGGGSRPPRNLAASSAVMSAQQASSRPDGRLCAVIETFAPVADYFTVNVSLPRRRVCSLHQAAALDMVVEGIEARRPVRHNAGDTPVLLRSARSHLAISTNVVHIARRAGSTA